VKGTKAFLKIRNRMLVLYLSMIFINVLRRDMQLPASKPIFHKGFVSIFKLDPVAVAALLLLRKS